MTMPLTRNGQPRRLGRSVIAVAGGFLATFALTLGTDQVLHVLQVFPPWGQPMRDAGLNLLALSYRIVFTAVGGWLTAKLAPSAPMRHALILGVIGFVLGSLSAVVTITQYDLGPAWYPILIVLTSLPSIWLGATLNEAGRGSQCRQ